MLRLVLAVSLDGRLALPYGGKDSLGSEGDREVLERALAWCDGTLMGSGTLTTHQNTCLIHNKSLIQERLNAGRSEQPISMVVSKNISFSKKLDFFDQPVTKWLLTPMGKNEFTSSKLFDNVLIMKEKWVDSLNELRKKGFSKLTVLGGTKLITSLLLEDVIDELQLTFTPKIIGGKHTWTACNVYNLPKKLNESNAWKLSTIEDLGNDEFMIKHIRNRN